MNLRPRPTILTLALSAIVASGLMASAVAQQQLQPLPPRQPDGPRVLPDLKLRPDLHQPLPPRPPGLGQRPEVSPKKTARPEPEGPPPLPTDPAQRLDALFGRLHDAENGVLAKKAEAEIEKLFERSGSPTVDLMFARSKQALIARDTDLALDLLDYVTAMQPRFAEAYHRRALIHVMRKDEEAALRDLKSVLGLEPRHYLALTGLAGLLRNGGDKKGAYKALTRAREINPWLGEVKEALEKLRLDVEGQKI